VGMGSSGDVTHREHLYGQLISIPRGQTHVHHSSVRTHNSISRVDVNPVRFTVNLITANFYFVSSVLPSGSELDATVSVSGSLLSEHNASTVLIHLSRQRRPSRENIWELKSRK
jgi:hypothetical protein